MWWSLINSGRNISVHHNWIDASCNHSQVQGQCAPGTSCKERLNISKDIYDNVFVPTKADFPPEAHQVILAAGPTLKKDDDENASTSGILHANRRLQQSVLFA